MSYETWKQTEAERRRADDAISDGYRVGNTNYTKMIAKQEDLAQRFYLAVMVILETETEATEQHSERFHQIWRRYIFHRRRVDELKEQKKVVDRAEAVAELRAKQRRERIARLRAEGS